MNVTKKIGIVGATGFVGYEVALLLDQMFDDEIIPLCRTEEKLSTFGAFGLRFRMGDLRSKKEAHVMLHDLDLLVDFSLPKGSFFSIIKNIWLNTRGINRSLKSQTPYIYISSLYAFGMPRRKNTLLKNYLLPRSQYGLMKRTAEYIVKINCILSRRKSYILRLGQVHGILQRKISSINDLTKLSSADIPKQKSAAIFTPEIAQYLHHLAWHNERRNSFTLISNPEWDWREVIGFYKNVSDNKLETASSTTPLKALPWQSIIVNEIPGERLLFPYLTKQKISACLIELGSRFLSKKQAADYSFKKLVGNDSF